jgi:NAD(P)-dependent dehydrogenase (short-subunit alcohol dehydrogenase family)
MRLKGKIGIVTAAASGIGRAGAVRFAREGATVAVVDINPQGVAETVAVIEREGGRAFGLTGNLREDDFSRAIVTDTVAREGRVDFVWNHVGHPGPGLMEGLDMADFDIAVDLNLRTVLVTTNEAIPHLRKSTGASLLFTSSVSGIVGSPFSPVYSAMKFGVVGLVRALARRLAPDGIRVNAVCPGTVDTPMLRSFVARPDLKSSTNQDAEMLVAEHTTRNPFGRAAQPAEIANAALFLISDEASYISGVALPVDGARAA